MAKYSKKCVLCGKTYEYCNTCASYQNKPIWSFSYCSEDCKDVVGILTDYIFNKISKEEAKSSIENKDTTRHIKYAGSYGRAYKEIMSDDNNANKNNESLKTEDIKNEMAQVTANEIKKNFTAEAKKTYPKSIAHKYGK